MKKVAIITFGCKINQYESACIADSFLNMEYELVDFDQEADVYIINSCTVTNRTDYKSRNAVRKALKAKEQNDSVKVIVTGCYSQRNKDEVMELGDIDLIADNNKKNEISEFVTGKSVEFENILDAEYYSEDTTSKMTDKTRAFVKVQDGCDYYCAYCAIPYARGHSRSRNKEDVLNQITELVENGYKEFVLGGINLGLYGREKQDNYYLHNLLTDIEKIKGVKKIRLSSLEPQLFTDELLDFFKRSQTICPHFHIPLQVGSAELLKSMNRRYTKHDFKTNLQKLYDIFPNAAIGFDLIVGLPGETEELFSETIQFLEDLNFTYLHVFSYSIRKGTKAEKMKGHVKGDIKKTRSNTLTELSNKKLSKYKEKIIEKNINLECVIEENKLGYWTGLSDHYVRIYLKNDAELKNQHLHLKPVALFKDGIEVEIIDQNR